MHMYKHTFTQVHPYTYKYTYICVLLIIQISHGKSLAVNSALGNSYCIIQHKGG